MMIPSVTLCFLLTFFFSLSSSFAEEDEVIPPFPELKDFQNLHVKSLMRKADGSVRSFEEYYDFTTGRGRVDEDVIVPESFRSHTFYKSDSLQLMVITKAKPYSDCTVKDINFSDIDTFVDMLDYDVTGENKLMYGPMAIWRRISRILKNKKHEKISNDGTRLVRGVKTTRYTMTVSNSETGITVTVRLYFMDEDWNKFEKTKLKIPVKFLIQGLAGESDFLSTEIEFFLVEDTASVDIMPAVGVGCEGVKSSEVNPGKSLFDTKPSIAMTIETLEKSNDITLLHRHELFLDAPDKLARFSTREDSKDRVYIQDLKRAVSYVRTDDKECVVENLLGSNDESMTGGRSTVSFARKLSEILFMEGNDFYYLGKTATRRALTSVYEKVLRDHRFDLFDDSPNGGIRYDKAVITHFISDQIDLDSMSRVPVKTRLIGYKKHEEGFQEVFHQEINYFNFRSLSYEEKVLDVFDVTDCIAAPSKRKYFDLYVKFDASDFILDERTSAIQGEIAKQIAQETGISVLRIGKVQVSPSQFADDPDDTQAQIMVNMLFLEKPDPLLSFTNVQKDVKPKKTDTNTKVGSIEECASFALDDNKYRGFYYCQGECYLTENLPGSSPGGDNAEEEKSCELYKRTIIDVDEKLNQEPDLMGLKEKLFELVKNQQLTFTITAKDVVETYLVDNIMVSQSPERFLEQKTFNMTIRAAQIDFEASPETSLQSKNLISSLGDCFLSCQEEKSFICESLSFCRDNQGAAKCILSSLMTSSENFKMKTEPTCDVYRRAYMSRFQEIQGSLIGSSGKKDISGVTNEEDCARLCSVETEFSCQSFAFCSGECLLKEGHALIDEIDKTKKEVANENECTLYTVKHLYEYVSRMEVIEDDSPLTELEAKDAESCASQCSLSKECSSFNFCTSTAKSSKIRCTLTAKNPLVKGTKTSKKEGCGNYFKPTVPVVPEEPKKEATEATPTEPQRLGMKPGYISGGKFTGIIFAMIFTGLILGVVGQLGWNTYKARRGSGDGLGLDVPSVRWTRQKDDEEE